MTPRFDAFPILLEVFWKSGVALGIALCLCGLLRKKSADVRRLVLSTVVVATFVSAMALPVLPRWTAFRFEQPAIPSPPRESPLANPMEFAPQASSPAPPQAVSSSVDLRPWLIPFVWFAFSATLLTRFAINLRGLRRLRNASEPVTDADLLAYVSRSGSRVRLWRNESIAAPVTWGIFRPVILVPAGFEKLPAEARQAVLCHELAHIQAHDFLMRGLAEVCHALIWFQPLIWIVRRQLREEQELSCDNRVLAAGGKPSAYAKLLLDWDTRPGMDYLIAVGIANRSCLKRRLYALLDPDLRRDTVGRAAAAGTWVSGVAMAIALAAMGFAQAIPVPQVITAPKPPVQIAQVQPVPAPRPAPKNEAAPIAALPAFEVASIKPSGPNDRIFGMFTYPGGRITATNYTAETLIEDAFDAQPFQIAGGPGWMKDLRFNLEAKPPASSQSSKSNPASIKLPPNDEQRLMLRALLIDRFQLKYQIVSREAPNYVLVKNGKPLRLQPPKDSNGFPWVGDPRGGAIGGAGLAGENSSMALLAKRLSPYVARPVLDQTGIEGSFDFRFDYAAGDEKPDVVATIFTSLQALGLKLEPARGPVETIMITSIEKPTEN